MWSAETTGVSSATPAEVFRVLAEPATWSEWNEGVADVRMDGPFATDSTAVMVFPDETELPFSLAWVEEERGFEDVTEVPDAGVVVRVTHELEPEGTSTRITYRCVVQGPDDAASDVGTGVSADFEEVITALAARAEQLHG